MSEARELMLQALDVDAGFLEAVRLPEAELLANQRLDTFCERHGPENAAAALAALTSMIMLMWAQTDDEDVNVLVDRVRQRLRGGDGPPSSAGLPRRPRPPGGGTPASARP